MAEEYKVEPFLLPSTPVYLGLTRRDYFANNAMQGLCVSCGDSMSIEEIAFRAYEMADAMIERSKKDD